MSTVEQAFGTLVRRTLKAQGKSQGWLAAAMNKHGLSVDNSSVSRLLSGSRATRFSEATVIAQILNLDLNAFVGHEPIQIDTVAPALVAELRDLVERWEAIA